ncbi:putative negative acting factor [Diaporthe ampelina]|uniref:Putative negative acting factor n=1 Tax=Diaporthe ampelina TaxID=1214573 RepID=A0A0G2IED8_9PEZI|nr:putative negative acting factor [Diaporthe ampelina]
MVNTGHPSRACKLCRARRIKCDETKPHCIKCRKSKRQCPGYRDPFEINLRDETQSTIRKAKAAAAQRRTARQDDKDTSSDESPTKSTHSASGSLARGRSSPHASDGSWETLTQSAWSSPASQVASLNRSSRSPTSSNGFGVFDFTYSSPTQDNSFDFNSAWSLPAAGYSIPIKRVAEALGSWDFSRSFDGTTWGCGDSFNNGVGSSVAPVCPGLQTPLDEQATCFFLSNFVLTLSTGQNPGLFSFVLKILQAPGIKDTPFPMAFTAVSLAALAGRPNSRHLLTKSQIYYSTALVQLKDVLQDRKRATDDTTLATAILLSFYEVT